MLLLSIAKMQFHSHPRKSEEEKTVSCVVTSENDGSVTKISTLHFLDEHKIQNEAPRVFEAMQAGVDSILRMTASQNLRTFARDKMIQILVMVLTNHDHRKRVCVEIKDIDPLLAAAMVSCLCQECGAQRERAKIENLLHPFGYEVVVGHNFEVLQREPVYPNLVTGRSDASVSPIRYEFVPLLEPRSLVMAN